MTTQKQFDENAKDSVTLNEGAPESSEKKELTDDELASVIGGSGGVQSISGTITPVVYSPPS
jgi:bacteriocin-like protein